MLGFAPLSTLALSTLPFVEEVVEPPLELPIQVGGFYPEEIQLKRPAAPAPASIPEPAVAAPAVVPLPSLEALQAVATALLPTGDPLQAQALELEALRLAALEAAQAAQRAQEEEELVVLLLAAQHAKRRRSIFAR